MSKPVTGLLGGRNGKNVSHEIRHGEAEVQGEQHCRPHQEVHSFSWVPREVCRVLQHKYIYITIRCWVCQQLWPHPQTQQPVQVYDNSTSPQWLTTIRYWKNIVTCYAYFSAVLKANHWLIGTAPRASVWYTCQNRLVLSMLLQPGMQLDLTVHKDSALAVDHVIHACLGLMLVLAHRQPPHRHTQGRKENKINKIKKNKKGEKILRLSVSI